MPRHTSAAFAVLAVLTVGGLGAALAQGEHGVEEAPPPAAPAVDAALMEEGAAVYTTNCSACHLEDGSFELAANSRLSSISTIAIQVINGGERMPPFGQLSNAQIAAVATYIRNSFGNSFGPVTEADIANWR